MTEPPGLLVVTGRATGIRYPIDRELVIGRASKSDIQLVDEAVSRSHAIVRPFEGGHEIEDLGSQNGVALNGVRLTGTAKLERGDAIAIGATTFLFDPPLALLTGRAGADVVLAEEETRIGRLVDLEVTGSERGGPAERASQMLVEMLATTVSNEAGSDLLSSALEVVRAQFGAERAFVLRTFRSARPRVLATSGDGFVTISRTIVERITEERRAIVSPDAASDLAFQNGVSLAAGEIRSLLAAPLIANGRMLGLVHLDRRSKDSYAVVDLEAYIPVANMLALLVLAAEGLARLTAKAEGADHLIDAPELVAVAPATRATLLEIERAATADSTVLIEGETGVGKEVFARHLHVTSDRRSGPFVAINCGAIPENLEESELFGYEPGAFTGATAQKRGLFEAASGGTLLLDEIGDCSPPTQVKLLRAIQERAIYRLGGTRAIHIDVRIVAATCRPLEEQVAEGRFREDLYYRLAVIRIDVPPLRRRKEDIAELCARFVRALCTEAKIPNKVIEADVIDLLCGHDWPGNIRELKNAIERLVIQTEGDRITKADLPADLLLGSDLAKKSVLRGDTLQETLGRVEREMILRVMVRTGGVKTAAAEALGISRVTLDAKLKLYDIEWRRS